MRRILVRLSFIGRNLYGTQKQPDKDTVQGIFEYVLERRFRKPMKALICSRLDRFVNAFDYVLSFDIEDETETIDHLAYYLRRSLPLDIQIKEVKEVSLTFHPRYDCLFKSYVYFIQNSENYNPLYLPFSSVELNPFNREKLKDGLSLLKGKHDFRYLSSPEGDENTIIELTDCMLIEETDNLYLRFVSKSFLRYQVRFMVGLLEQYALNQIQREDIEAILKGKEVKFIRLKAEGSGLTLEKICYPSLDEDTSIPKGKPLFLK